MKRRPVSRRLLIPVAILLLLITNPAGAQTDAPMLGWNSYDCYGTHINESLTLANLEAFIEKLNPYGYEYFVLDAGWYRHYDIKPGEVWPSKGDKAYLRYDEYGRFLPSKVLFPNGFMEIVDKAHRHGIKFGIHIMRGIPREVVKKDLPIFGTEYTARDIANVNDTCKWSSLCYGVDMDQPGAQEYYNSVVALAASWGVDFIKYDDIVHKPREIEAVANAIQNSGRDIIFSVSPGDDIDPELIGVYQRADMVRISRDIWDLSEDIDICFERWEKMQPYADLGFWLDLDMIPFGHIRVNYPNNPYFEESNRGYNRLDNFSYAQKKTFITQHALSASPLFMGGELTSSPNIVFELITNPEMLACNQNGVAGELETRIKTYSTFLDVWKTPHREKSGQGWIGIFNRNEYQENITLSKEALGLENGTSYQLYDIWGNRSIEDAASLYFEIPAEDVVFIRYSAN